MLRPLALLAVLALAGCVAPSLPAEPPGPAPGAGFEAEVGHTGCVEMGIGRQVSMEQARSLLPRGFEPRDAAGFLGYPVPLGLGFVASGLLRCEGGTLDPGPSEWADIIVYVEPPRVAGREAEEGRHDFYQLAHFTSGPRHRELLLAAGMPTFDAVVTHATEPSGTLGALQDEQGPVAEARIAVAPAGSVAYAMRFWHVTEAGLLTYTLDRTPTAIHLGAPVACTLRAGSLHALAFGGTDCAGADATMALFPEPSDFAGTLRFEPGVRVG